MRTAPLALLLLLLVFPAIAAAAPALVHSPTAMSTTRGDTLEVVVSANAEVPPLGCFALTLDYDPALLQLIGATEGSLFAGAGPATFFSADSTQPGADVISDCLLGFQTSVPPPGALAVLQFVTLEEGTVTLRHSVVTLRDVDRAVIAGVEADSTEILIGATSSPPSVAARSVLVARPNPSAGLTAFRLVAEDGASVVAPRFGALAPRLEVYDLAGRHVRSVTWAESSLAVHWDGRNQEGRPVASGTYFVRLRTEAGEHTGKVVRID